MCRKVGGGLERGGLEGDPVMCSSSCSVCCMMCTLYVRTQENGIMSRLRGIKDVFTEPRRKNEFQAVSV